MKRTVIRLPAELVERLDHLGARVRAANPGRSCSRSQLVRTLITPELAAAEQDGFHELVGRAIPARKKRDRKAR
jgi:metal-responsive CopG/Arc/MetJ family transcriptional regulator